MPELSFREGTTADLLETFALSERAMHDSAARHGAVPRDVPPTEDRIRADWARQRPLIEFIDAQRESRHLICENGGGQLVGYARMVRFGAMEELTELMVDPDHQGAGVGRSLLERCWPGDPTPELGRIVVAAGAPSDLTLYTEFGVMPIGGHWHMRASTDEYRLRRSQETDAPLPQVHVLTAERAVEEWTTLEPDAIGHERPELHEFFARDRSCLAYTRDGDRRSDSLCWVSASGEIGPAIGRTAGDLVPVVLAALDRVAVGRDLESLSVYATTLSWWLIRRLRRLGFRVFWPSWVMCSVPLPGLDRYAPTRPPHVL
ncbi:MAG: GNAT family N-acetyltransferase [Actinobacteria bacterium]|nr:GNAT family N-acetyltransferase [Actinomycetota bacterium]